jgi:hypothetical protein
MQFGGSGMTGGRDSGFCTHHNNAPSHASLVVQQFLTEKSIPVITQPPYSPNPALSDFQLFPALKIGLKGHILQPWRASNQIQQPNSRRFQNKPSLVLPTIED